ncbi:MAG: acyltransferase family protein [Limisphaerales bacterium]
MSQPLPKAQAGPRPELHALTSLRFFAAFHVLLFHTHGLIGDSQPVWLIEIASGGHHAVSLFFVLSGFILHHAYRHADLTQSGERRAYFIHRFARIYPVYALSFLVDAPRALGHFLGAYDPATGLFKAAVTGSAYLTLTQTWVPRLAAAWNVPGWSVSTEAFFYLLFPWLLPRIVRWSPARALAGLALTCAAAAAGQTLGPTIVEAVGGSAEIWHPWIRVFPPLRTFEFLFGMLLGRLTVATRDSQPIAAWAAAAFTGLGAIAVVALSNGFVVPGVGGHHGLLLPFDGILIVSLAVASNPIARCLSWRPLRFLGGASYAIYLFHMPVYSYFLRFTARDGEPGPDSPGVFLAYFATVLLVASAVFRFYEEPLRRFIRQRLSLSSAQASASDASPQSHPRVPPPDRSRFPPA